MWLVCTSETRAFHAGRRSERPKGGPSKPPSPAGFLIGIPRAACRYRHDSYANDHQRRLGWTSRRLSAQQGHQRGHLRRLARVGKAFPGGQKLPLVRILQGRHCNLIPHHDSCNGHLDVARRATGLAGRISQITHQDFMALIGRKSLDSFSRSLNQSSGTRGPIIRHFRRSSST